MHEEQSENLLTIIIPVGHPLIHLGYAYEMDNKEIAIEALALTSVQYDFLHKYTDDASYTRPSPFQSGRPLELLSRMTSDTRLQKLFKAPGFENLGPLFEKHEDLVLEYWNAWDLGTEPAARFRESQEAAAALLVATVPPGTHAYNFYVVHLLTTSHAVRVLLAFVPARFHVGLVRQWWLLTVAVYAACLCPAIDPDYIRPGEVAGKAWDYVEDRALNGPYATDAHYVKGMEPHAPYLSVIVYWTESSRHFLFPALRVLRDASRTWGDAHERYLAAAVRFADDFRGWVH